MLRINRHFVWSVFLILAVVINLMNVNVVLADDSTPPPPATEEPTQPPVEPTETPVAEETPAPTETPVSTEETPVSEEQVPAEEEPTVSELLAELPDNTELVVLDENGNPVPLASQEALNIILDTDPMWCPVVAGVPTLPGGVGCTINFATPQLLVNSMDSSNPATSNSPYEMDGVIYFTANPGGSFILIPGNSSSVAVDTNDYNVLKAYSLILQGGWNGVNGASTFPGQTNFGTNTLTIGTSGNPWVGNITMTNFTFSGVSSSNAVTVYTTTGNITLNNVDVTNQSGTNYTGFLQSNSGNIVVQNGSSFDGNNSGNNQNRGFSAQTGSPGSITISNTTFTEANGCGALFGFCILPTLINFNGATLSAPTVTLNSVTANNNDLNGIQINNANLVTLNNVTASNNGTDLILQPDSGDAGSGILVNGNGSTIVNVTGGTFNNNERYGLEVLNGILNGVTSISSCTGNDLGCVIDNIPPVLTLPANITVEATSAAGNVVTYSATALDNIDGVRPVTCVPTTGSTFAIATTTVNCSASDAAGNTANGSFTVTVQDTTPPVISAMANIVVTTLNWFGASATYISPATNDLVDGAGVATCNPSSGSLFPDGATTVTCTATDSRGNTSSITFNVYINYKPKVTSPSGSGGIIPVTGGELIDLNCFTVANAFGVLVTFHNLCDEQAVIEEVNEDSLPSALPSGVTFVKGVDVQVLHNGQLLTALPNDTGVQMDFPLPGGSDFVVLYWNNGEWVEVSQLMNDADLDAILSTDADNELYKMGSSNNSLNKALTTELTGTFVLVKK